MSQNKNLQHNQSGMVAITVIMILMIIISLVVIGFSATTRREQRQALDYQLASQAFYAAESGLNIAEKHLRDHTISIKDTCEDTLGWGYDVGDAKITCLLIDPSVESIRLDDVSMKSRTAFIDTAGAPFDKLHISWQNISSSSTGSCPGSGNFPINTAATWNCKDPLLRVDLIELKPSAGKIDSAQLKNDQFTAFLYPSAASGPPNMSVAGARGANLGIIQQTRCDSTGTYRCNMDVTLGVTENKFAVRIMSIYGSSNVDITARLGGGSPLTLIGDQAIVDVTARAQDVLKRIQARVKLSGAGSSIIPDFALNSDSGVCKQFTIFGGAGNGAAFPANPPECRAP